MNLHLYKYLSAVLIFTFALAPQVRAESADQGGTVAVSHSQQATLNPPAGKMDAASDPLKEIDDIHKNFNRVIEETRRRVRNYQQAGKSFEPDADFVEQGDSYSLKVDLPGMKKDQINVEATDSSIAISGERKTERRVGTPDQKGGTYQYERSSGSFYRRLSLPADADTGAITAKYENGVLELTIPKLRSAAAGNKKVAIQ